MRKYLLVASIAILAACSQGANDETAAEPTMAAATEEPAPVMAADGQAAPGLYKVTLEDGTVFTEDVKPDGTYVQTDADGKVVETGTWEQKSPEEYCYTVDAEYLEEGATPQQQCNAEQIGADGVWTSTNPEGKTATVERVTA